MPNITNNYLFIKKIILQNNFTQESLHVTTKPIITQMPNAITASA